MPLPTDEKIVALSQELLEKFDLIFGRTPRLSTSSRQRHHAAWNLYPNAGSGRAQQGSSLE